MSKKGKGRRLVVDACVARAAGESEAPTSKACREFLKAILEICHSVVMPEDIRREWSKHQSRFTVKWCGWMTARKKAPRTESVSPITLDYCGCPESAEDAMEKDLCLLEAAYAADKVIVTLDKKLQKALEATPDGRRLAKDVTWINPVEDKTKILESL